MAPSSFGKREREQAKRAKADAKRRRRQEAALADGDGEQATTEAEASAASAASTDDVLAMIADVHRQYEAGTLSFENFQAAKDDLLARIVVD